MMWSTTEDQQTLLQVVALQWLSEWQESLLYSSMLWFPVWSLVVMGTTRLRAAMVGWLEELCCVPSTGSFEELQYRWSWFLLQPVKA